MCAFRTQINSFLARRFAGNYKELVADVHWASTEINASQAWTVHFNTGGPYPGNNLKNNSYRARAVSSANFQPSL